MRNDKVKKTYRNLINWNYTVNNSYQSGFPRQQTFLPFYQKWLDMMPGYYHKIEYMFYLYLACLYSPIECRLMFDYLSTLFNYISHILLTTSAQCHISLVIKCWGKVQAIPREMTRQNMSIKHRATILEIQDQPKFGELRIGHKL